MAEVSNGMAAMSGDSEPIQNFVDENNGKAYNFALYAKPESAQGLDIGGSYYHDLLHPAGLGPVVERI